jgi:hypothetical protein
MTSSGYCEALPSPDAAAAQHLASAFGPHAFHETVRPHSFAFLGLPCPFHDMLLVFEVISSNCLEKESLKLNKSAVIVKPNNRDSLYTKSYYIGKKEKRSKKKITNSK